MVVCDLTAISRDLCLAVRERCNQATGIPKESIAISGTHSHTAPDYGRYLFRALSKPKIEEGDIKTVYAQRLIEGISQAIIAAQQTVSTRRGISRFCRADDDSDCFQSKVRHEGWQRTNLEEFEGSPSGPRGWPIDPEVNVSRSSPVAAANCKASFRTLLFIWIRSAACAGAPTILTFVEQSLRKATDPSLVSIFGTGCCGDINHADPNRSDRNKTDFIGNALAETVLRGLEGAQPLSSPTLQVRHTEVRLPLKEISQEQLARSVQTARLDRFRWKGEFLDQVAATKAIMLANFRGLCEPALAEKYLSWGLSKSCAGIGNELPVDVQTITLGDEVAIVFLPGEVFVDLGLAIKTRFAFFVTR